MFDIDSPPFSPTLAILTETMHQRMLRTKQATPRFLQGVFPFAGLSVFQVRPLDDKLSYAVPPGHSAEVIYFRAGNISDDILYLALSVNGTPIRYFPVGPKADLHVPLGIVESHPAGSRIDICIAAPRDLSGTVVVDVGILEIRNEP